ncbi:DUF4432 domain-containing protein [Paenibacillus baekrokdamisoli]|uniref:DUF4432 domain-containing protein n=1 Tax=Paenibacillus baekrokdamisoli TaxID=1712516 RepID=A0A3G9ISN6_9BACL|nr:DUF4432 family protein [Paenibacillus baekrokdamisoli]MBB3067783.1 hypothetical protein [Paenibacillus baekrokdamisoli]BBH19035.1 DUF4432 domain-containing protein [Paenibacillus baekrokdamisoli]
MLLYGQNWTRREVEARVGRLGQIGGVRRMMLTEGKEAGTEIIEVRTGAGLSFEVVPTKGLDISLAQLWGSPISWQSSNGNVHPMFYEPEGVGWLRTASGGLLMTCGLSHVGEPSKDETGSYGLHGRVHHTPANQVNIREQWMGDELEWEVSGVVEETSLFGSKLRLIRSISGRMGENRIVIADRVENFGFQPAPHMMLYHFNFGFPLLAEHTEIQLPSSDIEARGKDAPLDWCSKWQKPDSAASEAVYYHRVHLDAVNSNGMAEASLLNSRFPAGGTEKPVKVTLRWSVDSLPQLVQWRMPGAGEHVLGLEPSNCRVEGRAAEAQHGGPFILLPGSSAVYQLELNVT